MQFKTLAAVAFAASALASPDLVERQTSSGLNELSVYQVLQTALPPSLISLALTNSAAASSAIASEFAAGQTPSWFSGLPSNIQTYLVGAATTAAPAITAAASSLITSANSSVVAASGNLTAPTGANSTTATAAVNSTALITSTSSTSSPSTLGGSTSGAGSGGASSSGAGSSSSSAGAAMPTAVVGGGLVGALGLVGMLAL